MTRKRKTARSNNVPIGVVQAASLLLVLAGRLPALRKNSRGHRDGIKALHESFAGWPWLPVVLRSNRRLKGWLFGLPSNPINHVQCISPLKHASNEPFLTGKVNQRHTQKNEQDSLTGDEQHDDATDHQKQPEQVLADDQDSTGDWMFCAKRMDSRLVVGEIVGWHFHDEKPCQDDAADKHQGGNQDDPCCRTV